MSSATYIVLKVEIEKIIVWSIL